MRQLGWALSLAGCAAVMAVWGAQAPAEAEREGRRWWRYVEVLAADDMEGRNTGSPGHRRATDYVAQEMERAGLEPGGTSGYVQPVRFRVRRLLEAESSLEIVRGGKAEPLELGEEINIGTRTENAGRLEAGAVFAGYGLVIPEKNHDDLEGLDVKGKVVFYLNGGPRGVSAALRAHFGSAAERWAAYRKAGAVGMISIANPKSMDVPWERATLARLQPTMSLDDDAMQETAGVRLSATVNPAHAGRFFTGSRHTFAEILAAADAGRPLPRFPLPFALRSRVKIEHSKAESQNVIGVLRGTDPKLRDECVVLSAHLDHVGVGEPIRGDKIYNGAMDDASGVATLLDIARAMKESGRRAKRTLLFVTVTGEEKGLQGSKWFASHPTVRAASIVANLNVDMFLPIHPLKIMTVMGLEESDLGAALPAIAARYGVRIQSDPEPDRNLFVRSDQYSFIRQGVPALAFKVGFDKGSPEEKIQKQWLTERYHAPSDDLNQPVDFAAAGLFNRIVRDLALSVADQPGRPRWREESFFRRFVKSQPQ
jgi:hypothetical protein